MSTVRFMKRQVEKEQHKLDKAIERNAPSGDIENIRTKLNHFKNCVAALEKVNAQEVN